MRVLVLGSGVIGTTSAWYLRQAGFEVTVIDRQAAPGAETSFANGGQISVSHAEPWANPGAPLKLLGWLGRQDAPLLFRLRADMRQWLWGLSFLRNCTPARTRHNIRQIVRLGTAGQAAAHLPGHPIAAHHKIAKSRQRGHCANAVALARPGPAGDTGLAVDIDGAHTAIARPAAIAERQVRHGGCLGLEQHVQHHGLFGFFALGIVEGNHLLHAVAVGYNVNLHAFVASPIAPSAPPGMISGAAPLAPMMAR